MVISKVGFSVLFNSLLVMVLCKIFVQGFKGSRVQGFKGSRVQGFKGSRVQGFKGSRVQGFFCFGLCLSSWGFKGKPKTKRSKQKGVWFGANHWAALTSRSSGARYARPLNSSVMQNREDQNPKTKPDFAGSRIREDSALCGVLLSGNFSGLFLKQVKMVVTSFCLFFWVAVFPGLLPISQKLVLVGFKKSVAGNVQIGQ